MRGPKLLIFYLSPDDASERSESGLRSPILGMRGADFRSGGMNWGLGGLILGLKGLISGLRGLVWASGWKGGWEESKKIGTIVLSGTKGRRPLRGRSPKKGTVVIQFTIN